MHFQRTAVRWVVGLPVVAALLASPTAAVVGGTTTTGFPEVGALIQGTIHFCGGVLIGPACILTAAHCVDSGTITEMRFFLGADITGPADFEADLVAAAIHPQWAGTPGEFDLAVVSLASATAVPPLGFAASGGSGTSVTIVGLGSDGVGGDGVKRFASVDVVTLTSSVITTDGTVANFCSADSGSPVLVAPAGQLAIAGIASASDDQCESFSLSSRADNQAGFILPAMASICAPPGPEPVFDNGFEFDPPELDWSLVAPATSSCFGQCFLFEPGRACNCDGDCLSRFDCCQDICTACGPC
jgi:hypothetical protein